MQRCSCGLYSIAHLSEENMFRICLSDCREVSQFKISTFGYTTIMDLFGGSGLFVNKNGIGCNHHFLLPKDGTSYVFLAGEYLLEVYVESVDENTIKIFEQKLTLTKNQEDEMKRKKAGIYFDWAPNTQNYLPSIDTNKKGRINN